MTILNFVSDVLVAHEVASAPAGYAATSATSLLIGTGSKTFAVPAGLAYRVGNRVRLISASAGTNYMEGQLTAYSGSSMTALIDFIGPTATGTHADWAVTVAGEKGTGDLLSSNNLSDLPNLSTARNNLSVVHSVVGGTGITVTGGTGRDPVVSAAAACKGDNLLSNTNWLLMTKMAGVTNSSSVMKSDGTALSASISVSSFSPSSGFPTMLTSNTQELYNGCYVVFGPGLAGLSGWALQVTNVVPNVSFQVLIPFNKATPSSSSAITAYMCGISNSAANTYAPDHWVKTTALTMWVDDFATNACPGAVRVMGLRKGASGAEYFNVNTTGNYSVQSSTQRLRGRTVTFGAMVRCKVGGTGSKLIINDFLSGGGTTTTYSSVVTGTGFVDAAFNNYEFLTVTATISAASLHVDIGIEVNGAVGNIVYFAVPTLKYGSVMSRDDLGAPVRELVPAETHWNPPCSVPFGTGNALGVASVTPPVELVAGSGLYGWQGISIEAISYGQCHHSVLKVNCKMELNTSAVGCIIFLAALDFNPQLIFGPQASTQVANVVFCTNMSWLPLKKGDPSVGSPPGCFSLFSNNATQGIANITLDFDDVMGP